MFPLVHKILFFWDLSWLPMLEHYEIYRENQIADILWKDLATWVHGSTWQQSNKVEVGSPSRWGRCLPVHPIPSCVAGLAWATWLLVRTLDKTESRIPSCSHFCSWRAKIADGITAGRASKDLQGALAPASEGGRSLLSLHCHILNRLENMEAYQMGESRRN